MHVVGAVQDDHLFAGRGSLKHFVHPVQGQANIVLRDQIQNRNVSAPMECKLAPKNPWSWPGSSAGCKRHHCPDARLVIRGSEGRPTSKAMSDDSDPGLIKTNSGTIVQHAID